MKKLASIVSACLLSIVAFADPNEKVLRSFNETFTTAENVKWEEYSSYYAVSFSYSGIRSKVNYDKDGIIMSSIRYYDPMLLPSNILNKLKKEQPKRKLFGVTEVAVGDEVVYFVKLVDDKHWITLRIDAQGNSEVYEKYRKA